MLTIRILKATLLTAALCLAFVHSAHADWIAGRDLAADIAGGTPANPNGTVPQWAYGTETTLGGAFSTAIYTFTNALAGEPRLQGWQSASTGAVPDATVNVSGGPIAPSFAPGDAPQIPADKMFLHPGGTSGGGPDFSVVQWTAPATGMYLVAAQWQAISSGAVGVEAALLVNNNGGSPLADVKYLNATSPSTAYSGTLNLTAGTTLQFLVGPGPGGNNGSDHTMFDAQISAVPEPASSILFGLAALGLAWTFRKGRVSRSC